MWAEVTLGIVGCVGVLGAVWIANSYFWPEGLARQYAEANGIPWPDGGLLIPTGIANPVLIAIGVAVVMTVLATRRRFGRYVYAIGGNPDAAELGGINTRRTIMKTFILMGILAAVSAAVSTARLSRRSSASASGRSSRSSPRRSSAARRSPAASGRSRARSSAPWSCSRSSRAWSC